MTGPPSNSLRSFKNLGADFGRSRDLVRGFFSALAESGVSKKALAANQADHVRRLHAAQQNIFSVQK